MDQLFTVNAASFKGPFTSGQQQQATEALEAGRVVFLPQLTFPFTEEEKRFLTPNWSDGGAKNIRYDSSTGKIQGMDGEGADKRDLSAMLQRYSDATRDLMNGLFPRYEKLIQRRRTSYRPVEIKGRVSKITKDDTRLHPDQFPARPVGGKRIIRVFCNVNPHGKGRDWRVGEPFEDFARRFIDKIPQPFPGSLPLLHLLRVTRSRRTLFDHYMLHLHDMAKMDDQYQKSCPQFPFSFPAQGTWLCFTDEVLHAVDAGQYLLEQTYLLPVQAMNSPEKSTLRVLERLTGKTLV